ncbi:uncharacterized protein LOC123874160 [Maniola jurtina]|uniref:uncharacterized protein LOC123874160 n=1 Tax=Maniola jurtina TaxID=191418 RepID=UPI001E68ABA8|nr:uncharacterized protein LOC123874160 [Maniola jurtina]XP_045775333.1 uncharacterized protein LOC123874160 [Maniola jurtina]
MNGAVNNEVTMDTTETLMGTKSDNEGATTTSTSDIHTMEVEVDFSHQDQDGQTISDCDRLGGVCGPYFNCPCSIHSKTTVSDDEDQPLTDFFINRTNSIDNIETQSLQDAESQDTHRKDNQTNGDIFPNGEICIYGDVSNNSENNKDGSQSSLDQRHGVNVKLYAEDKGPKLYPINCNLKLIVRAKQVV